MINYYVVSFGVNVGLLNGVLVKISLNCTVDAGRQEAGPDDT